MLSRTSRSRMWSSISTPWSRARPVRPSQSRQPEPSGPDGPFVAAVCREPAAALAAPAEDCDAGRAGLASQEGEPARGQESWHVLYQDDGRPLRGAEALGGAQVG